MKTEKTAGVIGGMGPEATVDLMRRIIANTPAHDDSDHVRCLVDNNPKVPSRIKALIEGTGESPGPCMAEMGRNLERAGADFLAIACNTAHNYYADVQRAVSIPVLHMPRLTAEEARGSHPQAKRAGVLASPAVITTKLYEDALSRFGLEAVYPDQEEEAALLAVIKAIKAGDSGAASRKSLARIVDHLAAKRTDICIVGCTELGIIVEEYNIPTIDAAEVLAKAIIAAAKA